MKHTLIINASQHYPGWANGTLNRTMADTIHEAMTRHGHEVEQTVIENGYDAQEEVEKHLRADLIVLQTPVYWFGAPWIYKKYADEVFNAGLAGKSLPAFSCFDVIKAPRVDEEYRAACASTWRAWPPKRRRQRAHSAQHHLDETLRRQRHLAEPVRDAELPLAAAHRHVTQGHALDRETRDRDRHQRDSLPCGHQRLHRMELAGLLNDPRPDAVVLVQGHHGGMEAGRAISTSGRSPTVFIDTARSASGKSCGSTKAG